MILEGYFAKINDYPEDEIPIVVSRYYPRFLGKGLRFQPELAPSKRLLADYRAGGRATWEDYEKRFKEEMKDEKAKQAINDLAWASQYDTYRLLCYEKNPPCHRFILIDLINEALNEQNKIYETEEK